MMPTIRSALSLAYDVLVQLPTRCLYHGEKFEFLGTWQGEPRCDSCKQPARVVMAIQAVSEALGIEVTE